MLAEWSGGRDENLFPLCISTAFKLTYKESIKTNATQLDRVSMQDAL
jgi:hypothetical protein